MIGIRKLEGYIQKEKQKMETETNFMEELKEYFDKTTKEQIEKRLGSD